MAAEKLYHKPLAFVKRKNRKICTKIDFLKLKSLCIIRGCNFFQICYNSIKDKARAKEIEKKLKKIKKFLKKG